VGLLWWQHEPMAIRDRRPTTRRRDRHAFEDRRLQAAELFQQGIHQAEVARRLDVSRQTASRWHQRWQADGTDGLRSAGPPGRTPNLSVAQLDTVEQALLQGAKAHGCGTDLWTLGRIAEVIWRTTGVRHHPAHVWKLLRHRLGWSLQRPARRAQERDEQAIRQWVARDWPRIKKTPGAARPSSASSTSPGSR
jgi:transposase